MGLIGPRKEELAKHPPKSVLRGTWVVCKNPSSTLTKGKKYKVQGYFAYLNRKQCEGDHWFDYDQFITIKNNDGWTVKVNLINFELLSSIEDKQQKLNQYSSDPINILREAHEGEDEYYKQLEIELKNLQAI